jgi:hypothetical protein
MLKINGVAVATPKVFRVEISDIDGETTRNARGDIIRDRVATKRKLNCEWAPLTMAEISTLLKAVRNVFFTVEYPDPMEGKVITKTFYVGDRSTPMLCIKNGVPMWEGLTMNFIER